MIPLIKMTSAEGPDEEHWIDCLVVMGAASGSFCRIEKIQQSSWLTVRRVRVVVPLVRDQDDMKCL